MDLQVEEQLPGVIETGTFANKKGDALAYSWLAPKDYDPSKKYPLVLFLHGAGERGADGQRHVRVNGCDKFASSEFMEEYPCFVLAPQCPIDYRWVEVHWGDISHVQPAEPSMPMGLVLNILDRFLSDFSIDRNMIYVMGISMGGFGTWDIIARRPDFFAAAAPICGGGDEGTAPRIAHIPIWAFHGDKDESVKVERSRNMVAALKAAGGNIRYTEYPGVGHASWTPAFDDPELFSWLFSRRKPGS
jgi:predicted peptidase